MVISQAQESLSAPVTACGDGGTPPVSVRPWAGRVTPIARYIQAQPSGLAPMPSSLTMSNLVLPGFESSPGSHHTHNG